MRKDEGRARRRALGAIAIASVVGVAVVYLLGVRTGVGQRVDGVAFDRRFAVTAATTRDTNRLLGTVSAASMLACGVALVPLALARRRAALAVGVAVALGGSLATSEVLKEFVLTRPPLGDYGGVLYNTFPSGHATVGISVALGLVMVAPARLGRAATVVAALVATSFGTAVLSSGWHRPSDTIGAYLVTLAWFSGAAAVVAAHDRRLRPHPGGSDGSTSRLLLAVAASSVFGLLMFLLWTSVHTTHLRTVVYAAPYVVACVGIDLAGIAVVGGFYVAARGTVAPGHAVTRHRRA